MRISCTGCRNVAAPGTCASFGRSRLMICCRAHLALVQRLQRDEREAAVGGALAAGESHHVLHAGIGLDDAHRLAAPRPHRVERGILRPLHPARHGAGVLLREKSLGNFGDQENVQRRA